VVETGLGAEFLELDLGFEAVLGFHDYAHVSDRKLSLLYRRCLFSCVSGVFMVYWQKGQKTIPSTGFANCFADPA